MYVHIEKLQQWIRKKNIFKNKSVAGKFAPEYFVVDNSGERQPVEGLVALLPNFFAPVFAESVLTLEEERLVPIMLLPAIHLIHEHTYIYTSSQDFGSCYWSALHLWSRDFHGAV
jgi:hypothetical protein